ncbi:MAG: hypothetical protein JWR80_6676 [Bradyrhizobium sp.]|nr:hypothetical protein [Bradyrhizobium sp.]
MLGPRAEPTLFKMFRQRYRTEMTKQNRDRPDSDDLRTISAEHVGEMLANLQEAVVTADTDARRALLKGVISRLQEVLLQGAGA